MRSIQRKYYFDYITTPAYWLNVPSHLTVNSDNSIRKTTNNHGWDSGAALYRQFDSDFEFEITVDSRSTDASFMIGLTADTNVTGYADFTHGFLITGFNTRIALYSNGTGITDDLYNASEVGCKIIIKREETSVYVIIIKTDGSMETVLFPNESVGNTYVGVAFYSVCKIKDPIIRTILNDTFDLTNLRILDNNRDRVYFDSDIPLYGSTYLGFTISPNKTITGLSINSGQKTNHYFTVNSAFTSFDNPLISYSGYGSDINDGQNYLRRFDVVPIANNIGQLIQLDSFTDTDNVLIENHMPETGNQAAINGGNSKISGNVLIHGTTDGYAFWNTNANIHAIFLARQTGSTVQTLYVRQASPSVLNDNCLKITWSSNSASIIQIINSISTTLGTYSVNSTVVYNLIEIYCNGTIVKLMINKTLACTVTTSLTGGNYIGALIVTGFSINLLKVLQL